jgi:hypothetical protein
VVLVKYTTHTHNQLCLLEVVVEEEAAVVVVVVEEAEVEVVGADHLIWVHHQQVSIFYF